MRLYFSFQQSWRNGKGSWEMSWSDNGALGIANCVARGGIIGEITRLSAYHWCSVIFLLERELLRHAAVWSWVFCGFCGSNWLAEDTKDRPVPTLFAVGSRIRVIYLMTQPMTMEVDTRDSDSIKIEPCAVALASWLYMLVCQPKLTVQYDSDASWLRPLMPKSQCCIRDNLIYRHHSSSWWNCDPTWLLAFLVSLSISRRSAPSFEAWRNPRREEKRTKTVVKAKTYKNNDRRSFGLRNRLLCASLMESG